MKRIQGILGLLVAICVFTAIYNPLFLNETNLYNVIRWTALYGIISIGVAFVIITGGIDLSVGSVVGLTGCLLAMFLKVSFVETDEAYTVTEVDKTRRVLTVDKTISHLPDQDALLLQDPRTNQPRQMSIVRGRFDGLQVAQVSVRESVSWIEPGSRAIWKRKQHMNIFVAVTLVILISIVIGLIHGLLITKIKLQPFVVTLCGLLFYRGITRVLAGDKNVGFGPFHEGLKYLAKGKPFSVPVPFIQYISKGNWSSTAGDLEGDAVPLDFLGWINIPMPMLIMIGLAIISGIFLNKTIYGRYLLALGRNEKAAQYSGINTDRMVIVAYVICAALSGLGGILFVLDLNSVQPATHGNFYELYAIAAAGLGGCSLRGGEGSILGVVIGAAVMRALRNSINLVKIPTQLEFAIIGIVILAGVAIDEIVKTLVAKHRASRQAREMAAEAEET
jgi:ribose transport system permease protein